MEEYVSESFNLEGEYVLSIDKNGHLELLECGSTEEIEDSEEDLERLRFPVVIQDFINFGLHNPPRICKCSICLYRG
jgi:hypothetical protein